LSLAQARIHCYQHIELFLGAAKQLTILYSRPADSWNGRDVVTRKLALQPPIQVFVEEDSQDQAG
jgi:hypothetical protein